MKKRIKVLHVLKSSVYSGAENVVITIIKTLESNYDMAYLSTQGSIHQVLEDNNIESFLLGHYNYKNILTIVKEYQPDIIHAHDFTASVICALIPGTFQLISHLHYDPPWVNSWNIKSFTYYLCCPRIDKIFTVSSHMVDKMVFLKRFANKTVVVGNPIDKNKIINYSNLNNKVDSLKCDVLFVGRIVEQKNPQLFIDIIYSLKLRGMKNIQAYMIGDGDLMKTCQTLLKTRGLEENIKLLGFQRNPYIYMKQAGLVCVTSRWEGFGLVIAEANVLGTPVLSTRTSGGCHILGNDSWDFCDDEKEFTQKAWELLNDKHTYEARKIAALNRAKQFTDIEKYALMLSSKYSEEVEKNNGCNIRM